MRLKKRQRQLHRRVTEQINTASLLADPEQEDLYWHRLSDTFTQKDVIPATYLEIHNQCYEAYHANPLANAIIELTTSFVLGEGITVSARNQRVQSVINTFWQHPENHMDERVYALSTELALYGEQFIRFFVNRYDGSVIIRQIDPSLIDQIETDPEDIEKPLRYHRRPLASIATRSVEDQGTWLKAHTEVMQFAINKVSNARRGTSDLATLLPWLRRYKDWLTDRVRINRFKSAFLWDVQVTGADRKTLERKRMEYGYPPEPGSVLIHNEAEKWTAVQPAISANDVSADGRALKLMIAVGATLPEHYLSDGDNGNRATASEMALPTLLKFKRRQRTMRYMLTCILQRVILEAQQAGRLGAHIDTSFEITFPEIDARESNTLAQGLHWLVPALQSAKTAGWISDETAIRLLFEFAGEEIDIHAEIARIQRPSIPDAHTVKGAPHAT